MLKILPAFFQPQESERRDQWEAGARAMAGSVASLWPDVQQLRGDISIPSKNKWSRMGC